MDDLVLIDQQQIVTLLGKCDQPVGKAALGEQTIEHLIALPDKAVMEISRSCDFLLQRREDRQIDRLLMVLAFSDKQPLILAVNRRYVDLRIGIQIVMPIRADSGGNERKLSASAKLCKDVLADIFIRKRDKAADK